jgi:G3E family GTPase
VDASQLFGGTRDAKPYDVKPAHRHGINTFCLRRAEPLQAATLSLFLQVLAEHAGARLLRLKGLVDVKESPGRPAVIHGVQHVFHPPAWLDAWPDEDRSTRIVVISQGLDAQWLEDLLEAIEEEVNTCSIS